MLDVVGQPRAEAALRTPLEAGRFPHALVFHGPPGVGKCTAAIALAKVLLCHNRAEGSAEACGDCESCRLLSAAEGDPAADPAQRALSAGHPDLHVIVKELALYSHDAAARKRKLLSIPVDVVREHLIEPAFRSDRLGHGKVFVLDEAELLNPAGQNALLKTLEEPPDRGAGCAIILVTASPDKLLPTIRSRCRMVGFGPLADPDLGRVIDGWNRPDLSADQRTLAVRFACGSPGRAKLALDYGLTEWASAILAPIDAMTQGRAGAHLGEAMHARVQGFAEAWVKAHAQASKDAANRRGFELMTSMIAEHARRRLAEQAADCPTGDEDPAVFERDARLAPWLALIDAVREAEGWGAAHVNLTMACEGLARSAFEALRPATARA
ncbi:MAG: AAA family ATPase [Planctomycetota bacterium]